MGFVNDKTVNAVRKRHVCEGCNKFINPGESAVYWSGMTDGDFGSAYYHPECRAADVAYNHEYLGNRFYDEWYGLNDAEPCDYRWLKANHPVAYRRMLTPRKLMVA